MRTRWNCVDFQHFVNGVKKENPRYLVEQFSQIEKFLEKEDPDRATVAVVMKVCCEKWRYRFSQFKEARCGCIHHLKEGQRTIKVYDHTAKAGEYSSAFDTAD